MQIDRNTGLVLEGGGMRGVFTSGVLDAFMKYDLYFNYVIAVSAGSSNGISYISRQPRRARISAINFLARYNYIGLRNLLTQGCIFDQELLYDKMPNELLPFDYDAYFNSTTTFEVVTTNCLTGRAMYLTEKKDKRRTIDIIKASSSLPYVSKIVEIDGTPMLDGGIVDSIPVMRAMETGHPRNVVISTRNKGWRSTEKDIKIPHFLYKNYPRLRVALSRRVATYNEQLELLDKLEDSEQAFVIRPEKPLEVGRTTRDTAKLEALYEEGFTIGETFCKSQVSK